MATFLLTGATGTVGSAIARQLVARDGGSHTVRALVRSPQRASALLPGGIEMVAGDITDALAVQHAVRGADVVVHAAGLPEQWQRDPAVFDRVNAEGTRLVAEASLSEGVGCFLYTSTIDVLSFTPGAEFDESGVDTTPRETAYERSKQAADRAVVSAIERGLPARILHPAAVYGPAPVTTPGVNWFVQRLARGRIPMLLDGGMPLVFSDDVASGHILAMSAPVGSRYILSEAYTTLVDIARTVVELRGRGRVPPVMPGALATFAASAGEVFARLSRRPPLVAQGELHFLRSHRIPSSRRAREELGWNPRPLREGMRLTLDDMERRNVI